MNRRLKKMIKEASVISFDVFDTLVYRQKYDIQDVFIQTAIQSEMNIDRYVKSRLTAEKIAMSKNEGKPVDIENIYKNVDCQGKSVDSVINCELQIELHNIIQNREVYEIYQYCLEKGKRIIIISDMYIHEDTIATILKKCNYQEFEKIFVSSEYGKSKYKGDLYDDVKKNFSKQKILHIGDAKRSDFLNAKLHGLDAFHYKADYSKNKYYGLGYNKFGELFKAFKEWLDANLTSEKYDHIFFLAREGLFLQRLYAIDKKKDESKYLYVSRRSLTVPRLYYNNKYEDLDKVIVFSRAFTAKTFLKRLGIEKTDEEILEKTGILPDQIFYKDSYLKDKNLKKMYDIFYDEIISNAKSEWISLIRYLKVNRFEGKVAIVDIGWNGTMQNALQKIIDDSGLSVNKLDGYYLGINSQNIKQGRAHGFLYEDEKNKNSIKVAGSYGLFELITLAHHGSVKCYSGDEYCTPILYEYMDNSNIDQDLKKIDCIQEGIIDYIRYSERKSEYSACWDTFINPSKIDIELLGHLPFFDAEYSKLLNSSDWKYYFLNPKKFKDDFYLSVWKIGFLKKVFKAKLPYYKAYEKLRR